MSMAELEAVRTFLAGLDMLGDRLPIESEAHSLYVAERSTWVNYLETLEQDSPPWSTDPDETEIPWSQVMPGDQVKAPNGQWYGVDSVARLDVSRMSVLLVGGIKSTPKAQDKVLVRRGDAGRAVDVFRAGGLELEVIGK